MKHILTPKKLALAIALLSAPMLASALPESGTHLGVKNMSTWDYGGWGGSGSGGGTDCGGGGTDVPLDGGISLLLAAGLGYGTKVVAKRKQQKENQISK